MYVKGYTVGVLYMKPATICSSIRLFIYKWLLLLKVANLPKFQMGTFIGFIVL